MVGTPQGTAAIFTEVEASGFDRVYLGNRFEDAVPPGPGQPTDNGQAMYNVVEAELGERQATGYTATVSAGTTAPTPSLQGTITAEPDVTTAMDELWWEKVHILPRTKIEFGNIITQKTEQYEVYNALRSASVTTSSQTNNVTPGVSFPDESLPEVIEAQSSALDSTTTGQDSSVSPQIIGSLDNGRMVQRDVVAAQDGLPIFDDSVVFNMTGGNDVQLLLSGTRLVLMPMEYEAPVRETLAWLTDIITALDGNEQRIALRKNPRQIFEVTYKLDGAERQRMQSLIMDWTNNSFGFPLWHEKLYLSADVSVGGTSYSVADTSEVDLRVGGLAVVLSDNNTFDVINISSITATTIVASDPSVNAYPAGTAIMPMRTAIVLGAISASRHQNELEEFRVRFLVTDNDTGALTGDVSAYSTYDDGSTTGTRVLFDDCNVVEGPMPEQYKRRIYRIDNSTGVVKIGSTWDRNKRTHEKGFSLRSRAEILAFRKMLISLRGRQTAFYIPTFFDDVTVVAQLNTGSSTMDISNIEYERFIQSRRPKTIMKVTYDVGAGEVDIIRTITAAAGVDSTTERLTTGTDTWPTNITVAQVVRVQFYELVRFDADNVPINYPRIGLAQCKMPVVQVFDENV